MNRRAMRWTLAVLAVLVVLLAGLRIAAPTLITRYTNQALADLGNYQGHIDRVELALLRGGATVHGLVIEKIDSDIDIPLAVVPRADVSVQWNALLHGELVGEVVVESPRIHFVQQDDEVQYGEGVDWRAKLDELSPVRVNRLAVVDGEVHFQNPTSDPPVDVHLSDLELTAANLTNIREVAGPVYATVQMTATAMEHAPLRLNGRMDPWQEQPQFDVNFDLQNLDLVRLNALLKSYANITAEDGSFSIAGEVAAAEGRYEGYVKPLLDHAEFLSAEDFQERPLGAIWETVVAAFAELFENQPRDRVGTRVPLRGEFNPEPDVWAAVRGVFRNMFDAFLQGIEGSVDLRDALEQARDTD